MAQPASDPSSRRFYAHDRGVGRGSGHVVEGAGDFHDAAILFAETWAPADPAGEVSVIVKDCDSGEEQCFIVHLDEGEADPC